MKYVDSITQLIGNTPTLKANQLMDVFDLKANLFLKLECFNPLSSVKDRIALSMINDAKKRGLIDNDTTIIEPTSGNTGIALAYICASMQIPLILTMPESMSVERRKIITAFGTELVLTPANLGMKGAIEKAKELNKNNPNSIILSQFTNLANPHIHRQTTATEILNSLNGKVDALVCGVGTGGTITGVGEILKAYNKDTYIVAVEPKESAVLSQLPPGPHKIQGIGAGFIPDILNISIYDEIFTVDYQQAKQAANTLAKLEGVLCGISSGASLYAAIEIAKRPQFENENIVVILPDTGERYLSTDLFD